MPKGVAFNKQNKLTTEIWKQNKSQLTMLAINHIVLNLVFMSIQRKKPIKWQLVWKNFDSASITFIRCALTIITIYLLLHNDKGLQKPETYLSGILAIIFQFINRGKAPT